MDKQFKDYNFPDDRGHFEKFGGKFVPETLIPALEELDSHYSEAKGDTEFQNELADLLKHYSGRETALYFAANAGFKDVVDMLLMIKVSYFLHFHSIVTLFMCKSH